MILFEVILYIDTPLLEIWHRRIILSFLIKYILIKINNFVKNKMSKKFNCYQPQLEDHNVWQTALLHQLGDCTLRDLTTLFGNLLTSKQQCELRTTTFSFIRISILGFQLWTGDRPTVQVQREAALGVSSSLHCSVLMIDRQTGAGARRTDVKADVTAASICTHGVTTCAVDATDMWLFTAFVNICQHTHAHTNTTIAAWASSFSPSTGVVVSIEG